MSDRPLCLLLPGFDGTGRLFAPLLAEGRLPFEPRVVALPFGDIDRLALDDGAADDQKGSADDNSADDPMDFCLTRGATNMTIRAARTRWE